MDHSRRLGRSVVLRRARPREQHGTRPIARPPFALCPPRNGRTGDARQQRTAGAAVNGADPVLLVPLYLDANADRMREFLTCLEAQPPGAANTLLSRS